MENFIVVFIAIHFFLYPASNGFNSYFDKDEESIGGLKTPPKVTNDLYYVSLFFDLVAIALGLTVSTAFAAMLFIYGLISKAYSHPSVRLKKYPVFGLLAVSIFQGFFTFWMSYTGLSASQPFQFFEQEKLWWAAILSSLLLLGSYPMTQIYQHKEDAQRGDKTISLKLGISGTFAFTAVFFTFSTFLYALFFLNYFSKYTAITFPLFLLPVLLYFLRWFFQSLKNKEVVNFQNTMLLNLLSATCLNAFFLFLYFFT